MYKCGSWLHSQNSSGHPPHERWGHVEEGQAQWNMCAGTVLGDGLIPSNNLGEIWESSRVIFIMEGEKNYRRSKKIVPDQGFLTWALLTF